MENRIRVLIADGLAKEGIAILQQNSKIELLAFEAIDRVELKEKLSQIDILMKSYEECEIFKYTLNTY